MQVQVIELQYQMSLLQFLQQSILRDLNCETLERIQQQCTATSSLLQTMASLRDLDKQVIIHNRIQAIRSYISIKEGVYRALNGIEGDWFEQWISRVLGDGRLISQLLKFERAAVEKMIIQAIKNVFVLQQGHQRLENADQQTCISQALSRLQHLRECQQNRKRPTRQQVVEASNLDLEFQYYENKFQQKVQRFNAIMANYVSDMNQYQQKIRRDLGKLLCFEPVIQRQTPFKQLGQETEEKLKWHSRSSWKKEANEQISVFATKDDFYRQERPTRDTYSYNDTF